MSVMTLRQGEPRPTYVAYNQDVPPFSGVFTPIVTPFLDDRLDERGMRHNVERWMRTPLTGLVVLGSNGEATHLDDEEADRAIAVAREAVPRDRTLIAGTGRESTRATIAATSRAAALGVDAVMVRTPSFFKPQMTSPVFVQHYTAVADASPVPVYLYNVTMFTGVNLLPDAVEQLAAHPNIVGIKESGSDVAQIREYVARTPDEFVVLGGSATTYCEALCAGADGGVLALAGLLPELCVALRDLVRAGRLDDARDVQQRITPLARLIGTANGVPGLKAALDLLGYAGGAPRSPLRPATHAVVDALRTELSALCADISSGSSRKPQS
jgi:4-hydroxy-2-oxoglutarate aldolase